MRRRVPGLAPVLVAMSVTGSALTAPGDLTGPVEGERFLLSCVGAMAADGRARPDRSDPASRIVASAMVDLANRSVNGFGVGAAPIVAVTSDAIAFGEAAIDALIPASETAAAKLPKSGTTIEGSIDLADGSATLIVHPASEPARILISMDLDCRIEVAPG